MDKTFVGIDFGTCNLKVMYKKNNKFYELKLHKEINSMDGQTPNVILYAKNSKGNIEHIIGRSALKTADFPNTVKYIKKKLQQQNWKGFIPNLGRDVEVAEVSEDIFKFIGKQLDERIKNEKEIAITMPVCFSELQKKCLYDAAVAAGLEVKYVLSESFAAAFSQESFLSGDKERLSLIFDLGGATLDISLVKISGEGEDFTVEELASTGLAYGGTDIDEGILAEIFMPKYAELFKNLIDKGIDYKTKAIELIISMKEQLYEDAEDECEEYDVLGDGDMNEFHLSREEVVQVLEKQAIKERIFAVLEEMFDSLPDIIKEDVTDVRLFGGGSYIDYFPKLLTEFFGAEVFDYEDFDPTSLDRNDGNQLKTAVAAGAVRYITAKENGKIKVINRIPFHLGIKNNNRFKRILDRNRVWGNSNTGWVKLNNQEVQQDGFTINLYQTFANMPKIVPLTDDGSLIYMGKISLKKGLYDLQNPIFLKLFFDNQGKLEAHLAQAKLVDEENQIVDVEVKKFGLGGWS